MDDLMTICAECGKPFRGRKDKRFCCDCCRNSYNNKKRQKELSDADICSVNAVLFKNRMILKDLLGNTQEEKIFPLTQLLCRGFVWGFQTFQIETRTGLVIKFCYDYGYCFVTEHEVLISTKNARIIESGSNYDRFCG